MNFDEAITAHAEWKMKLSTYLRNPDGSLDAATIALDNKCPLGQWIVGAGAAYATTPEFIKLKAEHAHFHKAASEVVRKASGGRSVSEDLLLGGKSEFSAASSAVVSALMAIKGKVKH